MDSLIESVSGTLSNTAGASYLETDLVVANGSLMLWEPKHPTNPSTGTVLPAVPYNLGYAAAVTQFPNIAARPAAALLNTTPFDATLSIAGGRATVSAASGGSINQGDEIWNTAMTVLIAVVATFVSGTGGTGTYDVTPAQTFASAAVKIKPGSKPCVVRNDMQAAGNVENNFGYEWTPKGGLHVASSRTQMTGSSVYLSAILPGAIKNYIFANPGHEYFFSHWYYPTAALLAGFTGPYTFLGKNSGSGNFLASIYRTTSGTTTNFAIPVGTRNTVGMTVERFSNVWRGTALSNAGPDFLPHLFTFGGPIGAFGPTYANNNAFSAVLYRLYLEDLTVSGRTFATVGGLDDLAYSYAFGAGGRFNGDSYTAPATVMP